MADKFVRANLQVLAASRDATLSGVYPISIVAELREQRQAIFDGASGPRKRNGRE